MDTDHSAVLEFAHKYVLSVLAHPPWALGCEWRRGKRLGREGPCCARFSLSGTAPWANYCDHSFIVKHDFKTHSGKCTYIPCNLLCPVSPKCPSRIAN